MTYATLMVHLDGSGSNTARLDVTAGLAQRFGAKVIGIAACEPVHFSGDTYMDGELAVIERDIATNQLAKAQTDFETHEALKSHALAWHSIPTLENLTDLVAERARCADLVITGAEAAPGNRSTHADTGELVMRAGRPVLVVPDETVPTAFESVLVAWADTRECRRAIADAMPFLKDADRITIAEVSEDPATARIAVDDVIAWLGRHGIQADRKVSREGKSGSSALAAIAAKHDADLIVAGAYGHSRMREWMFGGVTRDLLLRERRCVLLAH